VCDLTDTERRYLSQTQSLTRDEAGREVLVGLTDWESDLLMAYRRQFATGLRDRDPQNLTTWLDLAQRHELARAPQATPDSSVWGPLDALRVSASTAVGITGSNLTIRGGRD